MIHIVSRHPATIAWLDGYAAKGQHCLTHKELYLSAIEPGDKVYGTLPLHLAAAVCEEGAEFYAVSLKIPRERKGEEIGADEIGEYISVTQYDVTEIIEVEEVPEVEPQRRNYSGGLAYHSRALDL